jgi:hypothetical protein
MFHKKNSYKKRANKTKRSYKTHKLRKGHKKNIKYFIKGSGPLDPININETGSELFEGQDYIVGEYLTKNENCLVFKFTDNLFLTTKQGLKKIIEDPESNSLFYECIEGRGSYGNDNVIKTQKYFDLKRIGIPFGVVKKEDIEQIITNPFASQFYRIIQTEKTLASIINISISDNPGRVSVVSGSHCQPGLSTPVFQIEQSLFTSEPLS